MTRSDTEGHEPAASDTRGHPAGARRAGRWRLLATAVLLLPACAAFAATPSKEAIRDVGVPTQCNVPDDTAMIEGPLPRLAKKLKSSDTLTVVVIGSGSAVGSGTSRKEAAFPHRFETRLQKAYAKPKIRMVVLAAMGQTASLSYARIAQEVLPLKPALVIWQTGSADAARGVPVMEFGSALERGIGDLRDQGSDVLLVDSQFSPRASLLVNTDGYREAVRWNARRYDLPLFKRYDTMQYWWSHEVFDLDAEDKASQTENADRIHDCVAALLVRVVERGIGAGPKT